MEYLKVHDWDQYQHYSQRNPPWIKLHVNILNNRKFTSLALASKGLLMQLWILASENKGQIADDLDEIRFRLRDPSIKQKDIYFLVSTGFLESCKQMLADASNVQADACLETETETEERQRQNNIPAVAFGSFGNVKLTSEEFQKLKDKFGEENATERIEKLSAYIAAKGKRYKSHYATILMWASKDGGGNGDRTNDAGHANSFLRAIREKNERNAARRVVTSPPEVQRPPSDRGRVSDHGGVPPDAVSGGSDRKNQGGSSH